MSDDERARLAEMLRDASPRGLVARPTRDEVRRYSGKLPEPEKPSSRYGPSPLIEVVPLLMSREIEREWIGESLARLGGSDPFERIKGCLKV